MQVRFEKLRLHDRGFIQCREPAPELRGAAPRSPLPEIRQPDLPQLEVRRVGQGDPEPRILAGREGEVGQRGACRREQRRPDALREFRLGEHVHAREACPPSPREEASQREQMVVLSLVPHPVPPKAA